MNKLHWKTVHTNTSSCFLGLREKKRSEARRKEKKNSLQGQDFLVSVFRVFDRFFFLQTKNKSHTQMQTLKSD